MKDVLNQEVEYSIFDKILCDRDLNFDKCIELENLNQTKEEFLSTRV